MRNLPGFAQSGTRFVKSITQSPAKSTGAAHHLSISGFREGDKEDAELHGHEAVREHARFEIARHLVQDKAGTGSVLLAQVSLREDAYVVGVPMDRAVVGDVTHRPKLMHGDDEAETTTGLEHGEERTQRLVHISDVFEDREGVHDVEGVRRKQSVDLLGKSLLKGH